jgi:mRNA-degrading endonuclease RelE of RelBE toxin-antitoxin system
VTYRVDLLPGVQAALDRLKVTDPAGTGVIVDAFAELADDPRIGQVLNEAHALCALHRSRLDPLTRRKLGYQITYRIHGEHAVVAVITAAAVPRPSRRR